MEFLKVYGKDDLQSLPHGTWGIKEPDLGWDGHTRLNGNRESLGKD
jgi:5-formyltetrahydrofolate cyclo-ligase